MVSPGGMRVYIISGLSGMSLASESEKADSMPVPLSHGGYYVFTSYDFKQLISRNLTYFQRDGNYNYW